MLENKCSRDQSCLHHDLRGRWIQDQQRCLADHFQWVKKDVALDALQPVRAIDIALDFNYLLFVFNSWKYCLDQRIVPFLT